MEKPDHKLRDGGDTAATCYAGDGAAPMRRAGFTMIEVMVAVALMAGLTAIVWASINNMFRTRDFMQKRSDRYQIIRVALDRMSSEIASAYIAGPAHGAEDRYSLDSQSSGSSSNQSQQQQAAEANARARREPVEFGMQGEDDRLDFTSFAHMRNIRDERTSHHAEIGYAVKQTRNDQGDLVDSLVRREDTTIDDDITQGGKVYTLIPRIEEIRFEYWDPGEADLGTEEEMGRGQWVDTWDTTNRQYHDRLPLRVRITVTLPPINAHSEPQSFTTQTEIKTHQMINL